MIALALALLVAQAQPLPFNPSRAQEADSVVLRPGAAHGPSFWSRAKRAVGDTVSRLWEKDEPNAAAGNMATLNGNVDEALQDYDAAEKRLPANSEAAATLAFDRSGAMLKGPPELGDKALDEARKARESGDASLRAKAAYNEGVALEAEGKPDEAIKAYASALSMDPDDVDSKVNLELLLQEHPKQKPQSGKSDQKDKKKPQDQKDQQQQQAKGKQNEKKDQQKKDDQQGDQKKQEQAQQDQSKQEKPQDKKEEQQQQGKDDQSQDRNGEKANPQEQKEQASMGRSEAQRLLDAARAGEKNLQMWRFGKKAPVRDRAPSEKDW